MTDPLVVIQATTKQTQERHWEVENDWGKWCCRCLLPWPCSDAVAAGVVLDAATLLIEQQAKIRGRAESIVRDGDDSCGHAEEIIALCMPEAERPRLGADCLCGHQYVNHYPPIGAGCSHRDCACEAFRPIEFTPDPRVSSDLLGES